MVGGNVRCNPDGTGLVEYGRMEKVVGDVMLNLLGYRVGDILELGKMC